MKYIKREVPFPLFEIRLKDLSDRELLTLSMESGTGLSLGEMKKVRDYFERIGRNPTDVELQSIGQAWSEHCCYKSSKPILKEFVFGIDAPYVLDRGDAGVVEFDAENAYALRIESHNHPSAVEPYGGAATGIGGIVRDVLAMGAQPIALIDPLFFGPPDYPYEKIPKGLKHPKYLFGGVVSGIRDYGNRIGIPTVAGCVVFHESYVGNCIVNVGCVGIAKKSRLLKNRVKNIDDVLILVGGRTGRDGIHGVTFASRVLTERSDKEDRGSVQLGDPIMKEPVIHACLEANERGLVNGLKDLGGGGLSCVVGEMALAGGFGAEVHLDSVPLKEEGLAPWEIWVSESQERMMLAVSPENVDKVLHIFKLYDVPATVVGNVIGEKVVRLYYRGVKVFDVDLNFLTAGPVYCRPHRMPQTSISEKRPKEQKDYTRTLLSLLSTPNIASKEWVIRQYDHEVRGGTVIKPLQGKIGVAVHGDAAVLKPVEESYRGLALALGINPFITSINPFRGGKNIIDEMCRNLVSVGARPHSLTNCLNFGNPEIPERLEEFYECVRGMAYVASALNIPIPSGNVSFYNESHEGSVLPTASVLGAGIVDDINKCVTSDFKKGGNPIYIIGETKDEMGGSAYYRLLKGSSSIVPDVDVQRLRCSIDILLQCIDKGYLAACHDISDGGLAVSLAEMCMGGDIGAEVDLSPLGNLRADVLLFSESNTRWLVEVRKEKEKKFMESISNIPSHKLGTTGGKDMNVGRKGRRLVSAQLSEMRDAWSKPLWKLMG